MPYGREADYYHKRQNPPKKFVKTSFRTVPISHVPHRKKYPRGTKAIVGKWKNPKKHRRAWGTQSVLVPKRKRGRR